MIGRLLVIGVGLIGGSLARALRRAGHVGEIVGLSRSQEHLAQARALGVIDEVAGGYGAASDADVVVVATPVGVTGAVLAELRPHLGPGTVVTDVGSVKGSVIAAARESLGDAFARFVPGHPIAGTERSGVEASFASLFDGRRVVLTPDADTSRDSRALVRAMWEAAGARVVELDAERHDEVFARTSHLPHVLAYALVDCLAGGRDGSAMFEFAAGGFFDFTRIASSDPGMWRDICASNRTQVVAALREYRAALDDALHALESGDAARLQAMFARAKEARDSLLPVNARSSSPE